MHKVHLTPTDKTVEVDDKKSLFEQLKEQGININSTCGGVASCSKCVVKVSAGEENMNEIPFEEKQILGNVFHITKERLCCQLFAKGDLTLDISDHVKKQEKKKKVLRRTMHEKNEILQKRDEARKEKSEKVREGGFKRPRAFKYDETEDTQSNDESNSENKEK